MVDAQAPGLARFVRELGAVLASGEGWQERLLERLARLYLLVDSFRRLDSLPAEVQADLRALVGWSVEQSELLALPGVSDRWLVLAQRVEQEERLRIQRTWLWSDHLGRGALILQFAHGAQPFETSLLVGSALQAELVFYPGAYPLRALIKTREATTALPGYSSTYATLEDALGAYAAALARNPWLEQFPLALQSVTPQHDGHWAVRDPNGWVLPLSGRFAHPWELLALSGGSALGLFGEWDGTALFPLSAWTQERIVRL